MGGSVSTREGSGIGHYAPLYSDDDGVDGEYGTSVSSSKRTSGRRTRRTYDPGSRRMSRGSGESGGGGSGGSGGDDLYIDQDEHYDDLAHLVPSTATPMAKPITISVGRLPEDFPQPSPAACGKRKVAELTAAQMLTASSRGDDYEGAQVLSALKGAALRPGEIVKRSRVNMSSTSLSIIHPDSIDTGDMGSTPGTPWDRELFALDGRDKKWMQSPRPGGLSTPSEQRDFLSKVVNFVKSADLAELRQILDAAKASAASLVGSNMATALDLQQDETSPAQAAVGATEGSLEASSSSSSSRIGSGSGVSPLTSSSVVARTLNRLGPQGTTCIIEACLNPLTHDQTVVMSICKVLLEYGASASVVGTNRASCLHYLAKSGYEKVARLLLNKGCPVDQVDSDGNSALHVAMQAGHAHFIELLSDFGVNCHIRNTQTRSALDLAGSTTETAGRRSELRQVMLSVEPRLRTLVLYHDDCLEHATRKLADWEGPDRLMGIMKRLQDRAEFAEYELEISAQFEKAAVELLSRVHSPEYIAFVDKLSKKLLLETGGESGNAPPVAFTPHVQRAMAMSNSSDIKSFSEHSDTAFSAGTLRAARRAAGAVAHAVDRVLLGRNRNAFCVVRPPGHHAGYRGLLDGAKSCGFCIFNSVAAGAAHALEGHNCERVAIVDLDIHHGEFGLACDFVCFLTLVPDPPSSTALPILGNGTEDIVRRYPNPSRIFFFSLHLYDKDSVPGYEFFPGSGASDDTVHNIINVPIMPKWHEQQGSRETATNVLSGREAYRQAITQRLIPALRAFNPDLILLSTGFDPVDGDVGNTRSGTSDGKAGMDLQPHDFQWVTAEILKIADICCSGRVVSVLEGGYGQYASEARGVAPQVRNTFPRLSEKSAQC